jgi:hypothetical protein
VSTNSELDQREWLVGYVVGGTASSNRLLDLAWIDGVLVAATQIGLFLQFQRRISRCTGISTMSNWHYNDNGQPRGPISTDELKAKIAAAEVSGTSMVWEVGTNEWREVRCFPDLVPMMQVPPPLPRLVTVAAGSRNIATAVVDALPAFGVGTVLVGIALAIAIPQMQDSGSAIAVSVMIGIAIAIALIVWLRPKQNLGLPSHAWKRFLAKLMDVELACLFAWLAVALLSPDSARTTMGIFLIAAAFALAAMDVGHRGKTLGRKIFGVDFAPSNSSGTAQDYFFRFVKMNFFGMALGIPLFSTVAMALAYKRLREKGESLCRQTKQSSLI